MLFGLVLVASGCKEDAAPDGKSDDDFKAEIAEGITALKQTVAQDVFKDCQPATQAHIAVLDGRLKSSSGDALEKLMNDVDRSRKIWMTSFSCEEGLQAMAPPQ